MLKPVRAVAAVFAFSLIAAWVGCGSSGNSGSGGNNCKEAPNSVCNQGDPVDGKCASSLEGKCCVYSDTDHSGGDFDTTVTCVNGMWQ